MSVQSHDLHLLTGAYAVAALTILGMIAATLADFRAQSAALRRLEETRDDLETTIKAEIMGAGLSWRGDLERRIEMLEAEEPQHRP